MCVISVLACRVFVVSKQQLTHRRSLSCCPCSPCVLDQQRCISCVTLKLSLNTDSALSCALVLSRNIWESALLSFAKTNQLCWQKKAEASLRLHPFSSHTHTHMLVRTLICANTFSNTWQWILSLLINSYIVQAADMAKRGTSETKRKKKKRLNESAGARLPSCWRI